MFMISKFMYDAAYKPRNFLSIEPYEQKNHISNFYYFRLGAEWRDGKVIPLEKRLAIPKYGFATIWSMERFKLGERILGIFGNLSELVLKGLDLVHSPSIDPGFDGSLALSIRNNTSRSIDILLGQRIGKILFFDVSDTIISSEDFVQNILKEKELVERKKAGEVMLKTYAEFMKEESEPNKN